MLKMVKNYLDVLDLIVMGDESWCLIYSPEASWFKIMTQTLGIH